MGRKRKLESDYISLACERGLIWLGPLPQKTIDKSLWQCPTGHTWQAAYHSLRKGTSCPHCNNHIPKTKDDYIALAEEKGFEWVGVEAPRTTHDPTEWRCVNGHTWNARYHDIQGGNKCPHCSGRAKKTEDDYRILASSIGFEWLGPKLVGTHEKTKWTCQNGHLLETTYSSLQQGKGCKYCSGKAKKTPQDYRSLAEESGFKWLGTSAVNRTTKTSWKCPERHTWEASLASIQRGSGCPHCAGLAPRTPHHYHVLAYERGFEWLGPDVPNVIHQTNWRCQNGHDFKASYSYVQQGIGCITCSGLKQKTPEDYRNLALSRGFTWLGPEVSNVGSKTEWKCSGNHKWCATYDNIRSGSGCPECQNIFNGARVSQPQIELCKLLNGELNRKHNKYTIDVAIIEGGHKIAIEYDCWYWHARFLDRDEMRDRELIGDGWKVLRIRTNQGLPPVDQILMKITELKCGMSYAEIIMPDWGKGPCFGD